MGRIIRYKLFESNIEDKRYIQECFLDISENPNFDVVDIIEVEPSFFKKSDVPMSAYKIHIELGKPIALPQPVNSNLYTGKIKTNLDFLKMKQEKISELLEDIDIALKRIKDDIPMSEYQIYANRRDDIDVVITIPTNLH